MVRPTPGTDSKAESSATDTDADASEALARRARSVIGSDQHRATEFLELLGKSDHPDAAADPVYALYQVAMDFQCSAHGYRELYLRKKPLKPDDTDE